MKFAGPTTKSDKRGNAPGTEASGTWVRVALPAAGADSVAAAWLKLCPSVFNCPISAMPEALSPAGSAGLMA